MNEKMYYVALVAKNQMGVSDISNIESIVPTQEMNLVLKEKIIMITQYKMKRLIMKM